MIVVGVSMNAPGQFPDKGSAVSRQTLTEIHRHLHAHWTEPALAEVKAEAQYLLRLTRDREWVDGDFLTVGQADSGATIEVPAGQWTVKTFKRAVSYLNTCLAFACKQHGHTLTAKLIWNGEGGYFRLEWTNFWAKSPRKRRRVSGAANKAPESRSSSCLATLNVDALLGTAPQSAPTTEVNEFDEWVAAAADIVGREKLVDEIHRLLVDGCPENTLLIHGEPGIGKTGVIQKYIEQYPLCARHFIVRSEGKNKAEYCLQNLCVQLIKHHGLQEQLLPKKDEDLETLQNRFHLLLRNLSNSPGARIVIDGLDELPEDTLRRWNNPLGIPERAFPGIFFLLSARHPSSLRLISPKLHEIKRDEKGQQDAILAYICHQCTPDTVQPDIPTTEKQKRQQKYAMKRNQRLERAGIAIDEFARRLGERGEWNFMYVRCVLWELGQDGDIDVQNLLTNLPSGLIPYFQDHWNRMWERKQQDKPLLRVLHALCKGRLWRRSWLSKIADISPSDVNTLVDGPWAMFLRCDSGDDNVPRYAFCHDKYLEFMKKSKNVTGTYEAFGLSFEKLDAELNRKLVGLLLEEQAEEK